jgi:chaperonin cofactor prefoldin
MRQFPIFLVVLMLRSQAAELPVREVVLYKHGVGYFERAGDIPPGETAHLDFKAVEMNDVLKSLTIQEKGGGKVSSIRYDSSEPLDKKLAEFPFEVVTALSAFLNQLSGARIALKFGGETVTGVIVSARTITSAEPPEGDKPVVVIDRGRLEKEQITVLLDSGDLRTLDLSAASSIHFEDPQLNAQLRDYLRTVATSRSKDRRSVYIDSTDAGTRNIVASYMIPTAVWKSSYRLIFDQSAQPTLEGWAIVDNTTGEDWTKVQLALVSGRPISFISQLYEPKYVQRQIAGLAEDRAQAPVVYEGSMNADMAASPKAANRLGGVMGGIVAGLGGGARRAPSNGNEEVGEIAQRMEVTPSAVTQTANTRDLGELFEYRFATPVTVKKSESAMLPFLQQKVTARKLLIYSDPNSQNPLNAAEVTNSTGKTLDGGPITVFDAGSYAGEALVSTVKTGDKRLISYGIDLGTRITTKFDSGGAIVREIHARRGLLTTRHAAQETRTYTIRNVDQKAKTLVIEHALRPQYKLLNQKPAETTTSAYRFEVKLAPAATATFPVIEEREYENSVLVTNMTPGMLIDYVQNTKLSDAARKQLQAIAQKKQEIADTQAEQRRTETQLNELIRDQDRIRQNIGSLNQVSGQQDQVQKYARTLADQEARLAGLRDKQNELMRRLAALESELNAMIEKIDF